MSYVVSQPVYASNHLARIMNKFPHTLKVSAVVPVFKRGHPLLIKNHKSISILSVFFFF